ncbi:hypothetical protein [Singulisphaera sp. PoT]|uniref:hypothetical protein n=1 Tax=Singulisphaera sp. PoT TaxID=3411797 RepID=UPI003BF4E7A0
MPIRRVFVHDREGTHRDEYFYTTDQAMGAGEVVTRYAGRRDLECTFQVGRAHLHSESIRGWSRLTVLRATPCLLGLYSVVTLLHDALPAQARVGGIDRPGKESVTSSDAPCAVRLRLWSEGVYREVGFDSRLEKLPAPLREWLCRALAPAAQGSAIGISRAYVTDSKSATTCGLKETAVSGRARRNQGLAKVKEPTDISSKRSA